MLAIQVQQAVQDEMKVACTGRGVTHALRLAHNCKTYVRIVRPLSSTTIMGSG